MYRDSCPSEHDPRVSEHRLHRADVRDFLPSVPDRSAAVVYIDPPYGTGSTMLGYRDDHSPVAWMALIDTVLGQVARIVTEDGVVAVSIGPDRLFELGAAVRRHFPDRAVTVVTVQASAGVTAGGFRNMSEYLLFITPERFQPGVLEWVPGVARSPWEGLTLSTSPPTEWPAQVYPVYVDAETLRIVGTGPTAAERGADWRDDVGRFPERVDGQPEGSVAVWPVTRHGKACVWRITPPTFASKLAGGHVKADLPHMPGNPNPFSVKHLPAGVLGRIRAGEITVRRIDERGAAEFDPIWRPAGVGVPTVWAQKHHRTSTGTQRLEQLVGAGCGFAFPKPVGLLTDMLRASGKRAGTVLDVFAGSASLLDATVTLNDTGQHQLTYLGVTNDESWQVAAARAVAVADEFGTTVALTAAHGVGDATATVAAA